MFFTKKNAKIFSVGGKGTAYSDKALQQRRVRQGLPAAVGSHQVAAEVRASSRSVQLHAMSGTEQTAPASSAASAVPALEASNLAKSFGGVQALKGVDLTINAGEVVALLG